MKRWNMLWGTADDNLTTMIDFEMTFDYLCPFARNACEAALAGTELRPRFRPFSLTQAHLADGEQPVWASPNGQSGLLALQWGVAIRDGIPDHFPAAHRALFAARHDQGGNIDDEAVVRRSVAEAGVNPDQVSELVAGGQPLKTIGAEHTEAVDRWKVFGVPTVIVGDEAAFVRFMERGRSDDLSRVVEMMAWTRLNEFKRTQLPR